MNSGVKTFGFGFRAFKRFPELVPLVTIMSAACGGASAFIGYALYTKPDVRIVKTRGPAYEDVSPTESRKLIDFDKAKYQPIPELEKLKKEIGSYKA